MENYKKIIKNRIKRLLLLICTLLVIKAFDILGILQQNVSEGFNKGIIEGFVAGLLTSIFLLSLLSILRYRKALADDTKLKILYNEENDERKKAIREKCGGNIIITYSVILVIAAIIASYYNIIIFYTLSACAGFEILATLVLKLYYLKKY